MQDIIYDREKAVAYAHAYAHDRNKRYYDFSALGGDCTNFVSQAIFAGCGRMNYSYPMGWYYRNANDRAPAWTSADALGRFLLQNRSAGPYARLCGRNELQKGDIVQLSFDGLVYTHSAVVVGVMGRIYDSDILLAAHTDDSDNRPLSSYDFESARFLHIIAARE